jgi:hypothetical protein
MRQLPGSTPQLQGQLQQYSRRSSLSLYSTSDPGGTTQVFTENEDRHVVYNYRLKCARDCYISLLLNTNRLDSYSTADRYAVFIGLEPL